jgi:hypothetical protein
VAALGEPGGLLDAKDPVSPGLNELIVDPALSADNPNNPAGQRASGMR